MTQVLHQATYFNAEFSINKWFEARLAGRMTAAAGPAAGEA